MQKIKQEDQFQTSFFQKKALFMVKGSSHYLSFNIL